MLCGRDAARLQEVVQELSGSSADSRRQVGRDPHKSLNVSRYVICDAPKEHYTFFSNLSLP